jgi:hypothetical protein
LKELSVHGRTILKYVLKEIEWVGVDWINVAQDWDK